MSIFFGLLFARRFYCRSALSLSPGRTGGLFPRINAPKKQDRSKLLLPCNYFKCILNFASVVAAVEKSKSTVVFFVCSSRLFRLLR